MAGSLSSDHPLWIYEQLHKSGNGKENLDEGAKDLVASLKVCTQNKDLQAGTRLHVDILKRNLLGKNTFVCSALINMYAKCGALRKGKEVLEGLPIRTIASWNALVAGYVQGGYAKEALGCLDCLQLEGISPNSVTFACILKACGSIGAIGKGEEVHTQIVSQCLQDGFIILGNALIDMYAKCGALAKVKAVLEWLPLRDLISWNGLIMGFAQNGYCKEAFNCLKCLQHEGLTPSKVTFACILKACGTVNELQMGEKLHSQIVKQGLYGGDVLGGALVDMYAKCGALDKAEKVLEGLPVRNLFTWSALISGYAQEEQGRGSLDCFERMQHEGLIPDAVTFICILRACSSLRDLDTGEKIHLEVVKLGLLDRHVGLGNALVDMYVNCDEFTKARKALEGLRGRDVVTWNALISGYVQGGYNEEALDCLEQMQREGFPPDAVTMACTLRACGSITALDKGQKMHFEIVRKRLLHGNDVLGCALIDMYAKCGMLVKAMELFEELPVRDVGPWNALITGYAQKGNGNEVMNCFEWMQHEGVPANAVTFASTLKACSIVQAFDMGAKVHSQMVRKGFLSRHPVLGNALVDMYAKCGALEKAKEVFEGRCAEDMVSWNALITGYVQENYCEEALNCFERMKNEGLTPDTFTFSCILKACGSVGALGKGTEVHAEICNQGFLNKNVVIGNALVDMYAKCGALAKAKGVLEALPVRDVVSWNALITGYVQGEHGQEALKCFEWMQHEGHFPDEVTFLCVLTACSRSGLFSKGLLYLTKMKSEYKILPNSDHHACMVDLFGRVGLLEKAVALIKKLPLSNYCPVWSTLLFACQNWGNQKLGRWAFEHAIELESSPTEAGFYTFVSDIYAAAGIKDAASKAEARKM